VSAVLVVIIGAITKVQTFASGLSVRLDAAMVFGITAVKTTVLTLAALASLAISAPTC